MATTTPNFNLVKPDLTDLADIRVINGNMDILDNMITNTDDADKQLLAPTLTLVKTLLSNLTIKNPTDVITALDTETLSGLGVSYSLTNTDAWYICLGKLFGGLIIQGGTTVDGPGSAEVAVFPIKFNKTFTVVGTLYDSSTDSKLNSDDAVTYTNTGVTFRYFTHKYIAFGI